jgi:hypothetical protein
MKRPEATPEFIGKRVRVDGYYKEGIRKIRGLMGQRTYPGGVTLDRPIDGIFVSWNVDELTLVDEDDNE